MKLLSIISFVLLALCPLVLSLRCSETKHGAYDQGREDARLENTWKMTVRESRSDIQKRNSKCPALYQRYSAEHTFCKVSKCDVISKGVNDDDKKRILEIHNSLRSKLASGQEHRYKQLPSAANMMQMEWDDELAQVAQAHANLCVFDHDDGNSRLVESFSVGQNLQGAGSSKKNWNGVQSWYKEEVCFYLPEYIKPFSFQKSYGHFTQFTWATTWKIGCGFTAYRENGGEKSLYTCNYGPAGNVKDQVHYIEGKACSQCPDNTECSTEYPGLCKSKTPDGPQIARPSSSNYILYCDFSNGDPQECKNVKVTGSQGFSTRHIYTGNYKTIVLQPGESITIDLGKGQDKNGICPFLYGRFGPNNAKDAIGSKMEVVFKYGGSNEMRQPLTPYGSSFQIVGLHMQSPMDFEVSFNYQVNEGAAPQYLDVKMWGIQRGKCKM